MLTRGGMPLEKSSALAAPMTTLLSKFCLGMFSKKSIMTAPLVALMSSSLVAASSANVATPKYLPLLATPKHSSELAEHDLLKVKFLNGRMLPWVFKDNTNGKEKLVNFEGSAKLMISDPEVMLDAALMHMGIARLGRHHAYAALRRGDLVEVLPRQQVPNEASMAIFYPHRAGLAPRVRVLVDFLLAQFAKDESLQATTKNHSAKKQRAAT